METIYEITNEKYSQETMYMTHTEFCAYLEDMASSWGWETTYLQYLRERVVECGNGLEIEHNEYRDREHIGDPVWYAYDDTNPQGEYFRKEEISTPQEAAEQYVSSGNFDTYTSTHILVTVIDIYGDKEIIKTRVISDNKARENQKKEEDERYCR